MALADSLKGHDVALLTQVIEDLAYELYSIGEILRKIRSDIQRGLQNGRVIVSLAELRDESFVADGTLCSDATQLALRLFTCLATFRDDLCTAIERQRSPEALTPADSSQELQVVDETSQQLAAAAHEDLPDRTSPSETITIVRQAQRSLFGEQNAPLSPGDSIDLSLNGQTVRGEVVQVDLDAGTADLCLSPTMELVTADLETLGVNQSHSSPESWTPSPISRVTLFDEGDAVEFERDGMELYGEAVAIDDARNEATVMLIPSEEYVVCTQDRLRKVEPDPLDYDLLRRGETLQEKESCDFAPRAAVSKQASPPLSSLAESIDGPAPREVVASRSALADRPLLFRDCEEHFKRLDSGEISLGEHRTTFARLRRFQGTFVAELLKYTNADQLKALAGQFGCHNAKRNTKTRNTELIYGAQLQRFSLRSSVQFNPLRESLADAIDRELDAMSEDDWQAHLTKANENRTNDVEVQPGTMTPSHVPADDPRLNREANRLSENEKQVEPNHVQGLALRLKQAWHSRRGCAVWIVQLSERVERAVYDELNRHAKSLGGWYSSFRKEDAGFHFLNEEHARMFLASLSPGDVDSPNVS